MQAGRPHHNARTTMKNPATVIAPTLACMSIAPIVVRASRLHDDYLIVVRASRLHERASNLARLPQ